MQYLLDETEVRVLGCLVEKELSTPEYYPLSLNALMLACNQRSNRDPVFSYGEEDVKKVTDGLLMKQLVWESATGRVTKYEHALGREEHLIVSELALLGELMLRGPQTAGELKVRCRRMHEFESQQELDEGLEHLSTLGFITRLSIQPGRKEARWAQVLSGQPVLAQEQRPVVAGPEPVDLRQQLSRIDSLEQEVAGLRAEVLSLAETVGRLKQLLE